MQNDSRHGRPHEVTVTASPLLDRLSNSDLNPADVATRQALAEFIEQDVVLQTGILPANLQLTEQLHLRGLRARPYTGTHTVRLDRTRAQRRRMKRASRIAYRPATLKEFPPRWTVVLLISGFSALFGVLLYFAMLYVQRYIDIVDKC